MKKTLYIAIALFALASCTENKGTKNGIKATVIETDNSNVSEPEMTFDHLTHDFGTITEGERVEHTFKFKNTGKNDLIISSCKASGGCTIPDWPREPVSPGEEGVIKVEFNSAGKGGMVSKDINILANTNPVKSTLQIKVFVEKKETAQ